MPDPDLLTMHAQERPKGTPVMSRGEAAMYLTLVPGWEIVDEGRAIRLTKRCSGFSDAVEQTRRVAELANAEDHHPDVRIYSYRMLELTYSTHSIGGLSENDFILAAKMNQLFDS